VPILYDMAKFKKTLLGVVVLMLATGGPITLFATSGVCRNWFAGPAANAAAAPQQSDAASTAPTDASDPVAKTADPAPTLSLAEVLRFDVTPSWVMQHWPRVSTGLPCLQLQGYRVALVTGTRVTDLAGSLTYYFNAQQQTQRITFRGTTGDTSALVALLTGRYGFARRMLNDPSVMLYEAVDSGNRPIGSAKIRSAKVINANQPYSRFEVELAMDRTE
jgi:hypothetical protein